MEMAGKRKLGITQEQAWDALNDPETLKMCIPGCDFFELVGENEYSVGLAVKIGPVSAKFKGKVTLRDIQMSRGYTIVFEGQGGVAGFAKGSSGVTLTPGEDGCELGYTARAQVGGKIAQLGQRLIDGAAKSTADGFFARFEDEMRRRHGPPPAETPPAEAPAGEGEPAESAMAGFMRKMGLGGKKPEN
jgi:carbon monoxide dehydrogenase subunit G